MEEGEQSQRQDAPMTDNHRRHHQTAVAATRIEKFGEDEEEEEEKVTPMMGTIRVAVAVKTIELAAGGGIGPGGRRQMR